MKKNNIDTINRSEISYAEIIQFIKDNWRPIIISGLIGAILGFGCWNIYASYRTEFILKISNKTFNIDLVTWRKLEKKYPYLAQNYIKEKGMKNIDWQIYEEMANPKWWSENVKLIFNISEKDKDFINLKNDDDNLKQIYAIQIHTKENNKEKAVDNAKNAAEFIKNSGAYIMIESIIDNYTKQAIETEMDISEDNIKLQLEAKNIKKKIDYLEKLQKQFPKNNLTYIMPEQKNVSNLYKYLPIENQLAIAYAEFYETNMKINNLNNRLEYINTIKEITDLATIELKNNMDGKSLLINLLSVLEDFKKKINSNDYEKLIKIIEFENKLKRVKTIMYDSMQMGDIKVTEGQNKIKTIVSGSLIMGFLTMILLLIRKFNNKLIINKI